MNGNGHDTFEEACRRADEQRKLHDAARQTWRDHVIGAQDLCDQVFPEVKFLVPGLFPEGVTLLVSRPKLGKSWMLLQIGSAIAGGVSALVSAEEPVRGDVLYLSLEDKERRVQRRMTVHFGARRECWPDRLRIASAWRRLDQGGLQDLRDWCRSVTKPTLVMIDTLKKVRPPKKHGASDYDADYEACETLIGLAHEFPGLAFIVAHHDRKMAADDVFDTVSGTLGLTAGVDTIAILKRSSQGVTLHIQGRDLVEDVEKAVRFDRETCRWTILGEAADVHRSGERARVLDALRNGPVQGLSVSEIMADAQIGSRDAAYQLLHRMTKDGEIARLGRGKYALPVPLLSGVSGSHDDRQAIDETEIKAASDTPDTPDRGAPANPAADAAVVLPLFPPTVWRRIHKGVKAPAGTRWRVFPNGIGVLYARFSLRLDIKSLRLDGKQRWVEESLHTTDPKVAKANLDALRLRRIAEAKASAHP